MEIFDQLPDVSAVDNDDVQMNDDPEVAHGGAPVPSREPSFPIEELMLAALDEAGPSEFTTASAAGTSGLFTLDELEAFADALPAHRGRVMKAPLADALSSVTPAASRTVNTRKRKANFEGLSATHSDGHTQAVINSINSIAQAAPPSTPLPAAPPSPLPTGGPRLDASFRFQHTDPLTLANASREKDVGHIALKLTVTPALTDQPQLHACLLVQTPDDFWASLDTMPPEQLAPCWDAQRDAHFTYIVDAHSRPSGLAGWGTNMKTDLPESLPTGSDPGTWTLIKTQGARVDLQPFPSTVVSGAADRRDKANPFDGHMFRALVYAVDRARYPGLIRVSSAFWIRKRATMNNTDNQVEDPSRTENRQTDLPLGPVPAPVPEKREPRVNKTDAKKLQDAVELADKRVNKSTKIVADKTADLAGARKPETRARYQELLENAQAKLQRHQEEARVARAAQAEAAAGAAEAAETEDIDAMRL